MRKSQGEFRTKSQEFFAKITSGMRIGSSKNENIEEDINSNERKRTLDSKK